MKSQSISLVQREYEKSVRTYATRWRRYLDKTNAATVRVLPEVCGSSVLDIGCGTGELLDQICADSIGSSLHGIDCSEAMLKAARLRINRRVKLILADAYSLPYPQQSFTLVVASNVLHYMEQLDEFIVESSRVLEEYGTLVITCWDDDHPFMKLRHASRLSRSRSPVFRHTSSDIAKALRAAGLSINRQYHFRAGLLWRLSTWTAKKASHGSFSGTPWY